MKSLEHFILHYVIKGIGFTRSCSCTGLSLVRYIVPKSDYLNRPSYFNLKSLLCCSFGVRCLTNKLCMVFITWLIFISYVKYPTVFKTFLRPQPFNLSPDPTASYDLVLEASSLRTFYRSKQTILSLNDVDKAYIISPIGFDMDN